jgi:site-specific recombinase XerD
VGERLLISEAFEIYRTDFIAFKGQSIKTEQGYLTTMRDFINHAGDVYLDEITLALLRDWKIRLENRVGTGTLIGYLKCLRKVIRYFWQQDYKCINPNIIPIPERPETTPDFLSPGEVTELIELAGSSVKGRSKVVRARNQAIIATLYASGIRASEMRDMNRDSIKEDLTFTVIGKRNKARLCFMDKRAMFYLNSYLELRRDDHPALFLSGQTGNRISPSMFKLIFTELSDKYGRRIHAHMFRHSFATNLLRNNTNPRYILDFLGHKDWQTIRTYTHVVNEDLRREYLAKHTM